MRFKYSFNNMKENMAKANGRDLGISTKKSVEICNNLRGKPLSKAKAMLERVIAKESAMPMTRFNRDTAHKPGIGPGKYPVRTAEGILSILKSAESNAQNKGLNTKELVVLHIAAHKAARPWHFGRKRRIKMKRTHIEVVLLEQVKEVKSGKGLKAETKKPEITETKKAEAPETKTTKQKETKK
jgi:large subunit ribosomal protein L22